MERDNEALELQFCGQAAGATSRAELQKPDGPFEEFKVRLRVWLRSCSLSLECVSLPATNAPLLLLLLHGRVRELEG